MWFGSQDPLVFMEVVCYAQDGWTALIVAAQNGHVSTVTLLLDKGALVDQANKVRWRYCVIPVQACMLTTTLTVL